jgi:predicted carbohydrate-binding protein with CBM5 and CBM33 domain
MQTFVVLLPLLGLACWSLLLQETAAHGYLAVPVSRNLYAGRQGTFYDVMSGNGLGMSGSTGGPGAHTAGVPQALCNQQLEAIAGAGSNHDLYVTPGIICSR